MSLVRLLYPMRCKLCGADLHGNDRILCTDCFMEGDFLLCDAFFITGANGADAALIYQDFVRRAMHAYKFQYRRAYADWFAQLTGDCLSGWLDMWRPEVITFVPLSAARHLQRGYNQSALVARLIARRFALPCERMLRKRLWVRAQSGVAHALRAKNVQKAFCARSGAAIAGKRVLLVDDVITTGATAEACVQLLRAAGAEAIFVLSMTKTPLRCKCPHPQAGRSPSHQAPQ